MSSADPTEEDREVEMLASMADEIAATQSENRRLEAEVARLTNKLGTAEREWAALANAAREDNARLTKERDEARAALVCQDCKEYRVKAEAQAAGAKLVAKDMQERVEAAQGQVRELQAKLETSEKYKQGYYNEAADGWSKFRSAERQVRELREALAAYEWDDEGHLVTWLSQGRVKALLARIPGEVSEAQREAWREEGRQMARRALDAAEKAVHGEEAPRGE